MAAEYVGTAGMLLEAFFRGFSLEELERIVVDLSKVLWISPSVVAAILKSAREGRR